MDENWVSLSECMRMYNKHPYQLAQEIQCRILREIGLTASIGISFNKIFSKLGSDYRKPASITYINRDNWKQIVFPLPVEDLLMVGRATEKKLKRRGIKRIGDLATCDVDDLRYWLGKYGEMLHTFANGLDRTPVARYDTLMEVKSIGNSQTLVRDVINIVEAKQVFFVLAESVAWRTIEQGFKGRVISISVTYIRNNELFGYTRQRKIQQFTNVSSVIADIATQLLADNHSFYYPIRALGVSLSDFEHENVCVQTNLFQDITKLDKTENLERTVYWLRNRFGNYSLQRASMMLYPELTSFSPHDDHDIHPVSFL